MISVFIDPVAHHRQPPILVASPIQPTRPEPKHPLDREILDALEAASEPMGVWNLLNEVARSSNPVTRSQSRAVRQEGLARINPLVRCGLVRRIGRRAVALA